MTSTLWPRGLLTALVTPLKNDELDLSALRELVEQQLRAGVSGLVVGGGTGEFGALSLDERRTLAREVIRLVEAQVPVVVQTGALATRDVMELSRDAQEAGAAGLMVASPFGEPISWEERLHFYRQLDATVSIPIMLYNTPAAGLLTFDQVKELGHLDNVTAIKDSSGNSELMGDVLEWAAMADFTVYVGVDSFLYDAVDAGADGAVFGTANLIPDILSALVRRLLDHGSTKESHALWHHVRPFLRFMEGSSNYIALCKAGCTLDGIDAGEVRAPYLMPDPQEVAELAQRLKEVRKAFENSPLTLAPSR